jgi:nucleoside-diphosphate-sugar epimerase
MKKILITGKNSYIGNRVEEWFEKTPSKYSVDKITVRDSSWEKVDFSCYDTVLHLAGIAHVSRDPKMEKLYYKVNRDLTVEIAKKAKSQGVKQFIFMSSIIVYGNSTTNLGEIDLNTVPKPKDFYGQSKLDAEKYINELADSNFNILVIRPPMIYGRGSKGNYRKLSTIAKKTPIFPDLDNERSMLHIDNLCEFIKLMIDNQESGLFFPQNVEYTKTSEMVEVIARVHGKKMVLTKTFNPLIKILIRRINIFNKMFGNLKYKKEISNYKEEYRIRSFIESIKQTEKN